MKFVDLNFENKQAVKDSRKSFKEIEKSGKYLLGEFLDRFELDFAKDQNVNHATCVKNATDALYMTFKLLECEKRTIVVPGFGAYPTVISAIQAGAKNIISAPIDESLTLDLSNVDIPRDSIIVPVHLYGNRARSKSIVDVAKATNSIIVEDCAQSTGLEKMPESYAAIHSFYPTKPLGCRGDGGAILTNDKHFADNCKKSRFYGLSDGLIKAWGFNSRMDEWQSSLLIEKLKYYRQMNEKRRENAKKYLKFGSSVSYSPDCVFHQYVDLFFDRSAVIGKLNSMRIPTMIHYPKMLSDMPHLAERVKFTTCKRVSDHVLSLPVGPHLIAGDITKITEIAHLASNRRINFEEIL